MAAAGVVCQSLYLNIHWQCAREQPHRPVGGGESKREIRGEKIYCKDTRIMLRQAPDTPRSNS
jgi:hypothetical protein